MLDVGDRHALEHGRLGDPVATIGTLCDRQPPEQPLRQRLGVAVGLPAADGPVLGHIGESVLRQSRIGEDAREQAHRRGESLWRRGDMALGDARGRAKTDRRLEIAEVLQHDAGAQSARPFHDQRGAQRRQRLLAGKRHPGPVPPGEMERLKAVLGHVDMAECEAARRRLPGDGLRLARQHQRKEREGTSDGRDCAPRDHGGVSFAGTRVPVTIRPGAENPFSMTATCSGVTAAMRLGQSARLS